MHMVVFLLLIFILLHKTICRLSFGFFSVVMTLLVKYGHDSTIWKDSSIEQISAKGLSCGSFGFQNNYSS